MHIRATKTPERLGPSPLLIYMSTFKFSLSYTKLETLTVKAYLGNSKINSGIKVSSVGNEPVMLGLFLCYTLMPTQLI